MDVRTTHGVLTMSAFCARWWVSSVSMRVADPDRVYIAGISNGGMMALRMLCEASELFAGAGTVIANMPTRIGPTCRPQRPVPIVMFNGTADPLIPYVGGGVGPLNLGGFVWGSERTAAHLASANGCGPSRQYADASTEESSVTRIAWSGCKAEADVTLYRINGGRHEVFGRPPVLPAMLQTRGQTISAAQTIMAAFEGEVTGLRTAGCAGEMMRASAALLVSTSAVSSG